MDASHPPLEERLRIDLGRYTLVDRLQVLITAQPEALAVACEAIGRSAATVQRWMRQGKHEELGAAVPAFAAAWHVSEDYLREGCQAVLVAGEAYLLRGAFGHVGTARCLCLTRSGELALDSVDGPRFNLAAYPPALVAYAEPWTAGTVIIRTDWTPERGIIQPVGVLALASMADKWEGALRQCCDRKPQAIVVDLGQVLTVTLVGMSCLVTAHDMATTARVPFAFTNVPAAIEARFQALNYRPPTADLLDFAPGPDIASPIVPRKPVV